MKDSLQHCTRWLLVAVTFLFAPVVLAQTSSDLAVSDNEYRIEFVDRDVVDGNTTFTYRVTELSGKDLSNWVLELCVDLKDILSWTPTESDAGIEEVNLGGDPLTGISGIKWNVKDDFDNDGDDDGDTRLFTVTLKGVYDVTSVAVGVKTANNVYLGTDTDTIDGPSCEVVCVPENKPFWDGNFTAIEAGKAKFIVDTYYGFVSVELDVSESANIALTGVAEGDGTAIPTTDLSFSGPLSGSFLPAGGYSRIDYVGSETLTQVKVFVSALEETNNAQFLFRITDECEFTGQMDPVLSVAAPQSYTLDQNYPNPFNPQTNIRFDLPEAADVSLVVYDALGRQVKVLVSGQMSPGSHEALWDGTDASGLRVPSGVYLYRLQAGEEVRIRQMTMLK